MKTTPLRIVGSTLSLFVQHSVTLWTMIGMLLVATALSLAAQPALTSASGLVGHWNFDEGSGSLAADSSGFGNDGQLVDRPSWWQSQGLARVALLFDGVDDRVNVGNSASLNPADEITLAAWVAPYDLSASGEIIAKSNGTDPQYFLRVQRGGKIRFGIGSAVLNGNTTLSPFQWHQVAGTYDGSTMKIYVDGGVDAVMSKNGQMQDNGVNVWIGCRNFQTPLAFNGLIDDPQIYSRALSANEIQALATPGQVVITSPANGQTFVVPIWEQCPGCPPLGANVELTADVFNFVAPVTKVDFYDADYPVEHLIGTATQAPYSVNYQYPGSYNKIRAVATDTLGNTVSSDPNAFSFYVCFEYLAPYLRINSPARGEVFAYGDPIYISFGIRDDCGVWFADGIDLYLDSALPMHLNRGDDFVWQNAAPGLHSILARSTSTDWLEDSLGITVVVSANPLITSYVQGTLRNDFDGWLGMKFTVGPSPIIVTELGRIFIAGNNGTHTVKLINASNGADVVGGGVSIAMAGGTAGQFTYVSLANPITLPANTAYYVVSQETPGGDSWATSNTTVTLTPAATCNGALLSNSASWKLRPPANTTFGPVNLKYQ